MPGVQGFLSSPFLRDALDRIHRRSLGMQEMKTVRCRCPGRWKDRLERWVVILRAPEPVALPDGTIPKIGLSELYCKDCRWKWKSRAKYVELLKDHVIRKVRPLTDEEILKRILENTLRIDPVTAIVESRLLPGPGNRIGEWKTLKPWPCSQGGGYQFIAIRGGGGERAIAVHRLQWMAAHRMVIPDGFDVDHVESPPRPELKCNAITNLRLRDSLDNQSEGPIWRQRHAESRAAGSEEGCVGPDF